MSFAIPPFTIHDMRRTGSTLLHEKGFSSDVIEKALNHTIGGVRGIYSRSAYLQVSILSKLRHEGYSRLARRDSPHSLPDIPYAGIVLTMRWRILADLSTK